MVQLLRDPCRKVTTNQHSPIDKVLCAIGAFFRFRNGLFPTIFLLVVFLVRPSFFCGRKGSGSLCRRLRFNNGAAGRNCRCLTIGLVYVKRGGLNSRVYAKDLVTEGIYAHTRNPMYTGNLLIALGFCLMYGSPWMYGVVFPFFLLVYMGIVFEEERFLREKFGTEYEE